MSVFFGFRLPDDLKEYLQSQAAKNRTSMGHYLVMLILMDMMGSDGKAGMQLEK